MNDYFIIGEVLPVEFNESGKQLIELQSLTCEVEQEKIS